MFKHLCQFLLATIILAVLARVECAPRVKNAVVGVDKNQTQNENTVYDHSKFEEVYDQRQNGSENYNVKLDGVAVMYVSPDSLLQALAPLLFDGGDADLIEEIMKPLKPVKPSGSTTTIATTTTSSSGLSSSLGEGSNLVVGSKSDARADVAMHPELPQHVVVKRKNPGRFPGLIKTFLSPTFH